MASPFYHSSRPIERLPSQAKSSRAIERSNKAYNALFFDPVIKELPRTWQFQEEIGEFICDTSDGTKWYIVKMEFRRRGKRYCINRLDAVGHIVVEDQMYKSEDEAVSELWKRVDYLERSMLENRKTKKNIGILKGDKADEV